MLEQRGSCELLLIKVLIWGRRRWREEVKGELPNCDRERAQMGEKQEYYFIF